jgi:hypothetical protein
MPGWCCVPGCTSNYKLHNKDPQSVFKFPKDTKKKELWIKAVHRPDFVPSSSSVICIGHFAEEYIIKETVIKLPDGTIVKEKNNRPKLTLNAIPSIFPTLPSYCTSIPPRKRTSVEKRESVRENERKSLHELFREEDHIANFDSFKCFYKKIVF